MIIDSLRKDDHVHHANDQYLSNDQNSFSGIRFIHHSFPQMAIEDVDLSTNIIGFESSLPIFINAMTGGSEMTTAINQKLAIIARECNLVMATGSVSVALKNPELADGFKEIRKENPNGKILVNIGAGRKLEDAKKAVDILQADGLQFHLNAPQEVVMPEGDRHYQTWLDDLDEIVNGLGLPVMVKEVGFGMSKETIKLLNDIGVAGIDISGRGGTNFADIENERRDLKDYAYLSNWGQTTAESLLEASTLNLSSQLIASGGIRTAYDAVKSLSLGAEAIGMSGFFLDMALHKKIDQAIENIQLWADHIASLMTLVGAKDISDLQKTDILLSQELSHYCQSRQIDWQYLASRSQNK